LKRVMKALRLAGYKEVTGITGVHDSGGDTGKLRKKFNIPAVGDIREVIAELSGVYQLNYKVPKWHKVGNYFLMLLTKRYGIVKATEILEEMFELKYKILPVSNSQTNLVAETDSGLIEGEHLIEKCGCKIRKIRLRPTVHANKIVLRYIKDSEWVIFSPGSLYTSILSLLLYRGMRKALKSVNNKLIIVNLARDLETTHIKFLSEYLDEFRKFGIDEFFVLVDSKERKWSIKKDVVGNNIFSFDVSEGKYHDEKKLSIALKKIIR